MQDSCIREIQPVQFCRSSRKSCTGYAKVMHEEIHSCAVYTKTAAGELARGNVQPAVEVWKYRQSMGKYVQKGNKCNKNQRRRM